MESILTSIKQLLGIEDDDHFDDDIIKHINSALMILNQLGVGPAEGFKITGEYETWNDFIPEDQNLEMVKSYVYLRVKPLFDLSTTSSAVIDSMNRTSTEFEWRLNVAAESKQ
jgi:hypothetical protein